MDSQNPAGDENEGGRPGCPASRIKKMFWLFKKTNNAAR